jgi:hypothetical protein
MGISKEIKSIEKEAARDLGIQDFFTSRDKKNRGTEGLINDTTNVLSKEIDTKERLYDESLMVNKIPSHVKPLFGGLFLTARRNKISENGIYLPTASYGKGTDTDMDVDFSDKQIVLCCGPHVDQLKCGMEVVIKMDNFKRKLESSMAQKINKEFEYVLPIEIIDGVEYLHLTERDIKYISNTNMISINPIT